MPDFDARLREYLQASEPITDDEIWENIQGRFDDLFELISIVRLETKEEAIAQRHGVNMEDRRIYWLDAQVGQKVRAWFVIPYDPKRDLDNFGFELNAAKELAKRIRQQLGERILSLELLTNWGWFCAFATSIELELSQDEPDLRYLKGGASQSNSQRRLWLSHLYMQCRIKGDRRIDVEAKVVSKIEALLERDHFPDPNFPRKWFEEFLGPDGDLRPAFGEKDLTFAAIKELSALPLERLPPFE